MPAAHDRWTTHPHGPLERLAENVWRLEGTLPDLPWIPRAMVVARRADGQLLVHNAIAVSDAVVAELEALGPIGWIVVPNGWHRLDCKAWRQRWPAAKVVCPEGARRSVEKVVPVDLDYAAFPDDGVVRLRYLPGVTPGEGLLEVRSADGLTVCFNDLVNHLEHGPGLQGLVYRFVAGTGRPGVHRMVACMLVRDRAAFRAELRRIAALPELRRVIVAHGRAETADPAGLLRGAADRFRW